MAKSKKNIWVLIILFFGPLVFYLFLLTGTNNFAQLPVLTAKVNNVSKLSSDEEVTLDDKITILCFFGNDLLHKKTNALNLNEKIYKHFYGYKNFQFVVVLPIGAEEKAKQLKKELGATTDVDKWFFVFGTDVQVQEIFESLQTDLSLDANFYSPDAFIIDREMSLRGRNDDEEEPNGILYGYNAESVAPIHKKMVDDVKVVLAEYRLELKKNKREI
jgi:hypothetical protein